MGVTILAAGPAAVGLTQRLAMPSNLQSSPLTKLQGTKALSSVKFLSSETSAKKSGAVHGRAAPRHWPLRASQTEAATNTTPSADVLQLWRTADAVCFDVDSTVCTDEGIDELAAFCGAGEAVAAWTTKAMTGNVPFQVALAARLEIMKPSARDVATYITTNPPKLSPGIKELVDAIKGNGADVYLVSGGFRQMIEPVALLLGVPRTNIFANNLLFDSENGDYVGFDEKEPTSRAGGKARVIEEIKAERGFKTLIMLGDGATDLEARKPGGADAFIGYGGVQVRPKVAAEADWFVYDFQVLIDALKA